MENLLKFLKTMSLDEFLKFECSMAIAAIEIKNISIIDTILGYRQEMTVDMGGKDSKSHDLDWLCETAVRVSPFNYHCKNTFARYKVVIQST